MSRSSQTAARPDIADDVAPPSDAASPCHKVETTTAGDLSSGLHAIFDPVSERALPIYFGPLLGRLYLEGL